MMTKEEVIQKQIDEIMDTFEFDKVAKFMYITDWTWEIGVNRHTPDEWELRQSARARLKEAAKSGFSMTGGFTARKNEGECPEEGKWVRMELQFGYSSLLDGECYE